jgi:hypothetical protein
MMAFTSTPTRPFEPCFKELLNRRVCSDLLAERLKLFDGLFVLASDLLLELVETALRLHSA